MGEGTHKHVSRGRVGAGGSSRRTRVCLSAPWPLKVISVRGSGARVVAISVPVRCWLRLLCIGVTRVCKRAANGSLTRGGVRALALWRVPATPVRDRFTLRIDRARLLLRLLREDRRHARVALVTPVADIARERRLCGVFVERGPRVPWVSAVRERDPTVEVRN